MSRPNAGAPAAHVARAPVPWWVLPAIVLAGFVGALMARWVDRPSASVAAESAGASSAASAASAGRPVAVQTLEPPRLAAPPAASLSPAVAARVALSGVLMVDGRPAMALVSVAGAPAVLVRPGDRVTASAVVSGIEANAMLLREGEQVSRIEVTAGPVTVAAAPLPPAATPAPQGAAPMAGAAAPPAGDAPGSGNAAFRAAIEDKVRSMNR